MPLTRNFLKFDRLLACTVAVAALAGLGYAAPAHAQVIGSYDNFDTFNDTGETAEGFEIDVEDVVPSDLTREFPSNFSQSWLIRYGLPTVTAYDYTGSAPDSEHPYDAGHKGVLVTWAAKYQGGKWVAPEGANPAAPGVSGNGTPFNPAPTLTAGESCWWWGLGAAYPASGCEHFGVSFGGTAHPGRITYHWKVPSKTLSGVLVNGALEASIPPSPVLYVAPAPPPKPNVPPPPPVVVAVARAPVDVGGDPNRPQDQEPQFGDAFWLKTTTTYSANRAVLEDLQVHVLNAAKVTKVVSWKLLQKPPGVGPNAGMAEREAAENDDFGDAKIVQVTKQYQYFKYSGAYDSETHQALCDQFYGSQTAALNGGTTVQVSCQNPNGDDYPYLRTYWTIDPGPGTALKVTGGNLGSYLGAHVNAYNAK